MTRIWNWILNLKLNWDAVSAVANWASAIIAGGALYLAYRVYKKPQFVERVGQALEDQKKLAQAEAQVVAEDNMAQGNRDVLLEHKVDAYTVIRNRATIDKDGRILKLYAHKGPWKVGGKGSHGDYREIDQSK
jgi:hypothetical protein